LKTLHKEFAKHRKIISLKTKNFNGSITRLMKIRKGKANLTFATLAHLFTLDGKQPQDVIVHKKDSNSKS